MASDMNGFPVKNLAGLLNINADSLAVSFNSDPSVMAGGNTAGAQGAAYTGVNLPPNKLGRDAIDFQEARASTDVASGVQSVILNGSRNTSSGLCSLTMGHLAVASGNYTTAIGFQASASGTYGFAYGYGANSTAASAIAMGSGSAATGQGAFCASSNGSATGIYSFASGLNAITNGVYGRRSHSAGGFGGIGGSCQVSDFGLQASTTDATPTVPTADAAAKAVTNQIVLSNNNTIAFSGKIIARQSGSTNAAAWKIEGMISRGTSAATTVIDVSSVIAISNVPAWTAPALAANTTLGTLEVTVTGVAATNIRWAVLVETMEIIYA